MSNKNINIDDLFKNQFQKSEEAFDPGAWDLMQLKLNEKDNKKGIFGFFKNKSITLIITTMITLVAGAVALNIIYKNNNPSASEYNKIEKQISVNSATNNRSNDSKINNNDEKNSVNFSEFVSDKNNSNNKQIFSNSKISLNNQGNIKSFVPTHNTYNHMNIINPMYYSRYIKAELIDTFVDEPSMNKMKRLINPYKRYRYDKPWLGIHLTGMTPINSWLDSGYRPGIGLNIELMSGDILKAKYMGLSWGGSVGFTWNGKNKNENIILATPNKDPGTTHLYNMGFHLDFIARAEFGNYRLKPYTDFILGIRNASTFQNISSNTSIDSFQNSSNDIIASSWMLQYGMSLGLRWHWVPGVSVDLRATYYSGNNINFVDVRNSKFNNGSYDLKNSSAKGDMLQLKLGLLFDLDEWDISDKSHHTINNSYTPSNNQTPIIQNKTYNNNTQPKIKNNNSGNSNPKPLKIAPPIKR